MQCYCMNSKQSATCWLTTNNRQHSTADHEVSKPEVYGTDQTQWSLTLGKGTGRDGEQVIIAKLDSPVAVPFEATAQSAVFSTANHFSFRITANRDTKRIHTGEIEY